MELFLDPKGDVLISFGVEETMGRPPKL